MALLKGIKQNEIVGTAVAVIAEPTLDQLVAKFAPMGRPWDKAIGALAVNYVLPGKGVAGSFKKSYTILAIADIVRYFAGSGLNLLGTTGTTTTNGSTDQVM